MYEYSQNANNEINNNKHKQFSREKVEKEESLTFTRRAKDSDAALEKV